MFSFVPPGLLPCRVAVRPARSNILVCTAQQPGGGKGPSEGEAPWGEFGTEGRMKKKRVRRRQNDEEDLDWDKLPSVPLVRPDASPESGEDYWMELDEVNDESKSAPEKAPKRKDIDDQLKERLKQEVVSPYTQNWILRVVVAVVVLIVLVAIFGGSENTPIIPVPDL